MTTGSFEQISATDVLRDLEAGQATGKLRVSGAIRRTIYFERGRPVYATSNALHERLGELLVREGKLVEADLIKGLSCCSVSRKLGTALVEEGLLEVTDLIWGLKQQVREIVLALFVLDRGTFSFEHCDFSREDFVKVHLRMNDVIPQGAELTQSQHAIGRTSTV